jgi:glyoxylase-like metal-dependent hydrolase (beta-lactamase superfamily II)
MIEITSHDDVTRLRMWTMRSAAIGYDVSAYLVRGVLIDTGFRHVEADLIRALTKLRARGVLVTHWHEDHAGNAPMLAEALPMWMPGGTEAKLRERPQVKWYRHFTWGRPNPLVSHLEPLDFHPLRAIPTPGHSADHHVLFDPDTATLFSGDLWLGVRVKVVGARENPYEILTSLDRAIALRPERMFDAHRGLVENPVVALQAKRQWLETTVLEIERRLDAGDDERAILRSVLGGEEKAAFFSQGEYSRRNLVRSVRENRSRPRVDNK